MKEVAILLLVALMLNGCGTSSTAVQAASGAIWQAQMIGGGRAGVRVQLHHAVYGERRRGGLTISTFQFSYTAAPVSPYYGETPTGTMT